jgi:hypothetical protein
LARLVRAESKVAHYEGLKAQIKTSGKTQHLGASSAEHCAAIPIAGSA